MFPFFFLFFALPAQAQTPTLETNPPPLSLPEPTVPFFEKTGPKQSLIPSPLVFTPGTGQTVTLVPGQSSFESATLTPAQSPVFPNSPIPVFPDSPIPVFPDSPSPPTPTYSLPPNQPYTLGGGDRIRLDLFDVPEYSTEYTVLVDGTLNLPLVGTVFVQDLTLEEAAAELSRRYKPFLSRPIVTVGLITPRPVRWGIAGEVNRPGAYSVPLAGRQFPSVTEAIELAGGITLAADVRVIQIRRVYKGQEQLYSVDLWQLLKQADLRQDITLRDGDSLLIPTTMIANQSEMRQLSGASFAPDQTPPLQIAVVGAVARAGTHTVSAEGANQPPTVTRAIEVAGGITSIADVRNIQIRRATRTDVEEVIKIDLWQLLMAGDFNQDVLLQSGDTVMIPEATQVNETEAGTLATASFSPDKLRVNVIGEVVSAGIKELPPNTPLNQAILAAGGFNNRARKSSVELIRLNANGTVTRRRIDLDLNEGINEKTNPILLNNDVVVVDRSLFARTTDLVGNVLGSVGSIFSFLNFFRIFGIFQ